MDLIVSSPDQPQLYQDRLRRFTRALASLSYAEQHLFHLRCYQEVPVKALAHRYGLTPTAVKGRLRRINRKLEPSYVAQRDD